MRDRRGFFGMAVIQAYGATIHLHTHTHTRTRAFAHTEHDPTEKTIQQSCIFHIVCMISFNFFGNGHLPASVAVPPAVHPFCPLYYINGRTAMFILFPSSAYTKTAFRRLLYGLLRVHKKYEICTLVYLAIDGICMLSPISADAVPSRISSNETGWSLQII